MSGLTKISEHVYWMPPGPPDRPSVCAVVGDRRTLMLDAGSSQAHIREIMDALANEGVAPPTAVAYTHSHWDHVFGGAELGGIVIAHASTAELLIELAGRDWSDEGLDRRVAAGLASPQHAAHIKDELPSPRSVEVARADIVFDDTLDIELGRVTVRIAHVGGDHSADSCVMYVEPDRVLFLGDCLCASPDDVLTTELALPLLDTLLGFDAELYVEGHHEAVSSPAEMRDFMEKIRFGERAAREGSATPTGDEDTDYFVEAFRASSSST
jgi:glyoxylase-like metal-dependent hydrolase (beta-lactamase superfamily II)